MAECEKLKACPFYNDKMKEEKGIVTLYKKRYCLGDNSICTRYMVASKLGGSKVPIHLYPNMTDQARSILAEAGTQVAVRQS
ncbi:MAG: hypothetical protein HC898_06365 [Phycisphaerales bacterium]|nr:hypothetical protein [Phycisphaerales bacterium]